MSLIFKIIIEIKINNGRIKCNDNFKNKVLLAMKSNKELLSLAFRRTRSKILDYNVVDIDKVAVETGMRGSRKILLHSTSVL
jgi:hypothetical protein